MQLVDHSQPLTSSGCHLSGPPTKRVLNCYWVKAKFHCDQFLVTSS